MIGASVSLRLKAVQIINLVRVVTDIRSSYGFGEEEGYVTTPAVTEEANFGCQSRRLLSLKVWKSV